MYEEQLERIHDSGMTLNVTMQGAESMYKELQGSVEDLKSNSSEVWQRLETDERRLDNLDKIISKVEDSYRRFERISCEFIRPSIQELSSTDNPR